MAEKYGIVMNNVKSGSESKAGLMLASLFDLQPSKMKQVIQAGTIIIFDNFTKSQAENILKLFRETTEGLVDFEVFSESSRPSCPKVNWPENVKLDGKELSEFATVEEEMQQHTCPHCGKPVSVVLSRPEDASSIPDTEKPLTAKAYSPSSSDVDTLEPIESDTLGNLEEAVPIDEEAMKITEDATEALDGELPVEEFEEGLSDTGSNLEAIEEEIPEASEAVEDAEEIPEAPEAAEEEESFSVYLGRVPSKKKKETAVEILAEIKGISEEEAAELINKPITPVAKKVSGDMAEEIREKFAAGNISVRVKKR